jgi:Pyruvate/2-oxoacid:ferredoxin oxidoreductase delta subunit
VANPYGIKTLINRTFAGRFFIAKLTRYPLFGKLLDALLFAEDDLLYLPVDRAIPINRRLTGWQDMVLPSQVLDRIIDQARHHWIMDFCICRDSADCKTYPKTLGCLFMGQATMDIHPKFGRPVTRREARAHAQKCREAGLVHLVGRNKLDAVWLGVKPGHKLFTVCNCCPCCCLWRILPDISPKIGDKLTKMPGVEVLVTERCVGCGTCTDNVCFTDAIIIENNQAKIGPACRGCGRCVSVCPNGAIELTITDGEFVERAVHKLTSAVDLS